MVRMTERMQRWGMQAVAALAGAAAAPVAAALAMPAASIPAAAVGALDLVWSLRSGLNVAALQCRNSALSSDYNLFLRRHASVLGAAYGAQEQRFRQQFKAGWRAAFDSALTRQYNTYVLLPDTAAFCRWATALAADLATRAPAELAQMAADATAAISPAGPILLVVERR